MARASAPIRADPRDAIVVDDFWHAACFNDSSPDGREIYVDDAGARTIVCTSAER